MTISVIIPTYNRAKYLKEAVESVWQQTLLPDEIIIGDDSASDDTEDLIWNKMIPQSPIPIRYYHNKPTLKQAKNVDSLFHHAMGDLVLLIHDDDLLYPQCLELLKAPFETNPEIIASFGNQSLINDDGCELKVSEKLNTDYFRISERAGVVDGFFAGATAMFPNDGFLVKRREALSIGYYDNEKSGDAIDFYFGYRLGKLEKPFYYIDKYTAKYRITKDSISNRRGNAAYKKMIILLEELTQKQQNIPEIYQSIKFCMPVAISIAANEKDRKNAMKWYFSKYHREKILTLGGIRRFLFIINPF